MNRLILAIFFSLLLIPAWCQNLSQITLDNRGNADVISFLADESIIVNMTKDGRIIEWGVTDNTGRAIYYPLSLAKYMGREEYYAATENEAYRGKIKYLGRTLFTYYTSADNEALKGKVKTMGNSFFDYYTAYDNAAFKNNLKNAGPVSFTYYSSFDDESYKGKIRTVGPVTLAYYGLIDDKAYRGKIKSIDRNTYTYYSSYDRKEYGGAMKTGSSTQFAGGIKYVIIN